ncbi:hypothetical protein PC9H_008886 [Pleurotus ostreatus]|uniref:Uncharacterized protein n=1 Tax=Pleurotus ostreatus TaxID=5322 RepID=A0A8H6ZS01_PLEOS|nr:uncharacterized protein PC9H_008886 [Pleurotus ostreatus]KAF7426517.1 hypothetical protein PC9H_008886 [Pleurotus ostreatus]
MSLRSSTACVRAQHVLWTTTRDRAKVRVSLSSTPGGDSQWWIDADWHQSQASSSAQRAYRVHSYQTGNASTRVPLGRSSRRKTSLPALHATRPAPPALATPSSASPARTTSLPPQTQVRANLSFKHLLLHHINLMHIVPPRLRLVLRRRLQPVHRLPARAPRPRQRPLPLHLREIAVPQPHVLLLPAM